MKTAEKILEQYRDDSQFPQMNCIIFNKNQCIEAMEEYASECIREKYTLLDEALISLLTDIEKNMLYPDAISQHQTDQNIGWIRCMRYVSKKINSFLNEFEL